MSAAYRWRITKDHISSMGKLKFKDDPNVCSDCGVVLTPGQAKLGFCRQHSSVGVEGPRDLDDKIITNPARFSLYDDDDICYYEGMLYGDYEGFEPLDDYGTPNAGCVKMKLDGQWL